MPPMSCATSLPSKTDRCGCHSPGFAVRMSQFSGQSRRHKQTLSRMETACGGSALALSSSNAGSSRGQAKRVASSLFGVRSGCARIRLTMASQTAAVGGRWRKARRTAAKPRDCIQESQSVRGGREGEGTRPPEPDRERDVLQEDRREEEGARAAHRRREQSRA
eukprot:scaffold2868_cov75-Isochrysis_galbana.AAC.2